MDEYTGFAEVYDTFMDNVPYEEWADCLVGLLREQGIDDGLVLDLGCGTGSMTESFAGRGYDMIGVDSADDRLEIALRKKERSGHDILYLSQDMREFELYGTVRAVISVCDCINYVTNGEELVEVFRLVNNYLDPGGIFLFDFNTRYKYEHVLGSRTFAESRDECSFIWDNYYDEDEGVNEYELTLFIQEEGQEGLYRRYQEIHYQKGYTLAEIRRYIGQSGMEFLGAYDGYTRKAAEADSERILVAARERGKTL